VIQGKPAADGSFDVLVHGSPNDAFVVKVQAGGVASRAVYVVRGSAAVGDGVGGALSCDQRDQLAGELLTRVGSGADASCSVDGDCRTVLESARCHASCEYATVSQLGQRELEAASESLDAGLCADFTNDGCPTVFLSCVGPPRVVCSSGQCVQAGQPAAFSCQQLQQMAGEQLTAAIAAADQSCAVDSDCAVAFTEVACLVPCPGAGPLVASRAGVDAIAAAVTSINQGSCADSAANGCSVLPPPCPMRPPGSPTVPICMAGRCALGPAASCKSSVPAAPSGCHAAGYYLQCTQGDVTTFCVSDSATQCPDLGGTGTCIDRCTDSEYAVGCGGVGPNAPSFTPPAGCRGFGRSPGGGSEAFCCPCESVSR
jgi:hypothetical protein